MLKELTEYGNNIEEEMKVTLREIKKNLQGTNSEGKESWIQINSLEHKEEIKSVSTQWRKQEFKKQGEY